MENQLNEPHLSWHHPVKASLILQMLSVLLWFWFWCDDSIKENESDPLCVCIVLIDNPLLCFTKPRIQFIPYTNPKPVFHTVFRDVLMDDD